MAASKRKTNISRKNGQPTPSSSRVGTRSQTPASKASQRNTPVPTNVKPRTNGHLNTKPSATNGDQVPSTPSEETTNGPKGTENAVISPLTEANVAELSNGQDQARTKTCAESACSSLSSPPASMRGPLADYFGLSVDELFPPKEVKYVPSSEEKVDGAADEVDDALDELKKSEQTQNDIATPSKSSPRESRQASPALVESTPAEVDFPAPRQNGIQDALEPTEKDTSTDAPNRIQTSSSHATTVFGKAENRQESPGPVESATAKEDAPAKGEISFPGSSDLTTLASTEKETLVDTSNAVSHQSSAPTADLSTHAESSSDIANEVQGSPASVTTVPAEVETVVDAANGDESPSRSSRKRSLSSADELALPDPPVKLDSTRTIARPRRKTRSNSPSSQAQDDSTRKLDEADSLAGEASKSAEEPVRRSKRAKSDRKADIEFDPDDMELPYDEATPFEIAEWDGWLEMESNPETLTVMLQEWGVQGMKAIDVYSLEPEDLVVLPQPVYGLIFLYPYREGDWGEQMDPCPDHVWFANQMDGTNACGTVGLTNILMNVPDAKLGPYLQALKTETQSMNSIERGKYLNNFRPIKAVHNSFIHVNEMMEDDLTAEKDHEAYVKKAATEAQKRAKAKLAAKKKKAAEKAARKRERAAAKAAAQVEAEGMPINSRKSSPTDKTGAGVTKSGVATKKKAPVKKANAANTKKKMSASGKIKKETPAMAKAAVKKKADALAHARHHYVAYLPINGELWKLDGMDDQPLNLGPCDQDTWLHSAAPLIQASMADLSEENIDFSLLAVVQDPLYNDTVDLAANIKTMQHVDEELAKADPDWPMHEDAADCMGDESLDGPSEDYKITAEMIDTAELSSTCHEELQASNSVGSLLKLKKSLISQQKMLKSSIRSGKAEEDERQEQVNMRRRDFGPLIQWQLMDLIDNGVLDELLDLHDPKTQNGGDKKVNGKAKSKPKGRKR